MKHPTPNCPIEPVRRIECLVLAAGNGLRLKPLSSRIPKPLVRVGGKPLLEHVILSAEEAGINTFLIVVGDRAELVRRHFATKSCPRRTLRWVENPEYEKENGVSALQARNLLREPFLLLMGDHLFEPRTGKALLKQPLQEGEVVLAVDRKLDRIFDLEDATKVRLQEDLVTDIGKEIAPYDAVDAGMFLCSHGLFEALQTSLKDGNCSLSDGMRHLACHRRLRAFDIGNALLQDVDTPQAVAYAETLFHRSLSSQEGPDSTESELA
jgi:choline kinase